MVSNKGMFQPLFVGILILNYKYFDKFQFIFHSLLFNKNEIKINNVGLYNKIYISTLAPHWVRGYRPLEKESGMVGRN